jgi:hypothetical protein
VIRHGAGPGFPADTRDDGLCFSCGDASPREVPVLCWRRPDEVRLGLEVPLVRWLDLGKFAVLDTPVRRYARSEARAHVGGGTTPPEQIWEPWREPNANGDGTFTAGVQTKVDTRSGGFASTPVYEATFTLKDATDVVLIEIVQTLVRGTRLLSHVFNPTPDDFILRIPSGDEVRTNRSGISPIAVSWIGVEPASGCPPTGDEFRGRTVRCCGEPGSLRQGPLE